MKKSGFAISILFVLLTGCAGISVHDDLKVPPGRIEGNQFTGIRYPFRVSVPPQWKMSTEFPEFMKELGYDRPTPYDNEVTELYIFNPSTKSSIQIDFTPANASAKFSQESIEALTATATGSLMEELEKDYGREVKPEISSTTPFKLKGVSFAAKRYALYTVDGVKREQGWIYGFGEPYQIFILYMIVGREGGTDAQDIGKILDSFEMISGRQGSQTR